MPILLDIPGKLFRKELKNKALSRYFDVVSGKEKPKFRLLDKKELNNKIMKSSEILTSCGLCERQCLVNRARGKKAGYCRLKDDMIVGSYYEHHGEEQWFIPSFNILFWSCNFDCQYCQNWAISQRKEQGTIMNAVELSKIINDIDNSKTLNFTGGEPTLHLSGILETLKLVEKDIPILWNSNFYMSEQSMNLLKGIVDVYLSDFKYGNDECAERLSGLTNYTDVVKRNHLLASQDSEMVIRHLVLPGHTECCTKPILDWIAENLGNKVIVNLMDQYKPEYKAALYQEINKYLNVNDFKEVTDYAKKLKLNLIY